MLTIPLPGNPRRRRAFGPCTVLALALSGCGLLGTSPGGGGERTSINGDYDYEGTSPTGEFVELAFADESVSVGQIAAGAQLVYAGDTAGEQEFLAALGGQATDPIAGLAAAGEYPGATGTTVANTDDGSYTGYTGSTEEPADGYGVASHALGTAALAMAVPLAEGPSMLGTGGTIVAVRRTARSGPSSDPVTIVEGAAVGSLPVAASSGTLARLGARVRGRFSSPNAAASTIAQQVAATGPAGRALAAAVELLVLHAISSSTPIGDAAASSRDLASERGSQSCSSVKEHSALLLAAQRPSTSGRNTYIHLCVEPDNLTVSETSIFPEAQGSLIYFCNALDSNSNAFVNALNLTGATVYPHPLSPGECKHIGTTTSEHLAGLVPGTSPYSHNQPRRGYLVRHPSFPALDRPVLLGLRSVDH